MTAMLIAEGAEIDAEMGVAIGDRYEMARTVTDADLLFFAACSGDFDPVHMNEEYAKTTVFGRRLAHGLYTLGLLSGVEFIFSCTIVKRGCTYKPVSLGYEGIRFLKPVFVGDTLTAGYTVESIDKEKLRAVGDCRITKQTGELVLVAKHIVKWT